jgi:hypothetical protein
MINLKTYTLHQFIAKYAYSLLCKLVYCARSLAFPAL